jgi:hypothetical protein
VGREALVDEGVVGPVPSLLPKGMRMMVVGKKEQNMDIPVTKVLYIEADEALQHLGIVVWVR